MISTPRILIVVAHNETFLEQVNAERTIEL